MALLFPSPNAQHLTQYLSDIYFLIYYKYIVQYLQFSVALLHKDLKVKTSHIYSNLSDNSGMWSA